MDLLTLLIVTTGQYALTTLALILLWLQFKNKFNGLMFFWMHSLLGLVGTLSITFRPMMQETFSILLSNTSLLLGLIFLFTGFKRFLNYDRSCLTIYIMAPLAWVVILFFAIIHPMMQYRQAIVSLYLVLVTAQILWIFHQQTAILPRKTTLQVQVALVLLNAIHLWRLLYNLLGPERPQTYFDNTIFEAVFSLAQVLAYIVLTFAMLNLVGLRQREIILAEEAKFNAIFTYSTFACLLTRLSDSIITDVNDSFLQLTGYSRDLIVGRRAFESGLWVDSAVRADIMEHLSEEHPVESLEVKIRRSKGSIVPCLFSAKLIWINNQQFILSTLSDITDVVALRGKLEKMASHDPLTRLPNRNLFEDRFTVANAQANRSASKFAIAIFDIDDFKKVNDQFGHTLGDQVLIAVAERASHYLRLSDTVARFGGDEFVILLSNVQNKASALDTLTRILELYQTPLMIQGHPIQVQISLGAALYPDDGVSLSELLHKADDALYQVKRTGKNNVLFISPEF